MFGTVRFYIEVALVVGLVGLGLLSWGFYKDSQLAHQKYEQALAVNKANQKAIRDLKADWQIERLATEKELAEAQKRASAIEKVKKELENAPGANDPAGAYFDELGKRLRSLNGTPDAES